MTLRSILLGDCDHYLSPYIFAVAQGMARLGHWHTQISLRHPPELLKQRIRDIRPDLLWTHMLLWPPPGSPPVERLISLCEGAAKQGARVILHDGDYKERTRFPHSLAGWCALALCNHLFDRSAWKVPTLHWPYCAFSQDAIAPPVSAWSCDLWFAGQRSTDKVYAERTALLGALPKLGVGLRLPTEAEGNTLFQTMHIAPSAQAVLGFGRPGVRGWVDTRVFQYPGAGGILLHDDTGGYLEPWTHYVPYRAGNAESVAEALRQIQALDGTAQQALRTRAFSFVQEQHSSVARVRQVLAALGLAC
jgi:hypothetical protein